MGIVSANLLIGADIVDRSTYTTGSISPAAGALITLFVLSRLAAGAPNTPTVTGCSLTWVQINTTLNSGGNRRVTMFRAMGPAPSSGTLSIDHAGQTQTECDWVIDQHTGVDGGGANGAGAIVQSGVGTDGGTPGTTGTVSLSAFSSPYNMAYGGIVVQTSAVTISPGSGFTELAENITSEAGTDLESEYQLNQPSITWTWGAANTWLAIGIEIKAATFTPAIQLQPDCSRGLIIV